MHRPVDNHWESFTWRLSWAVFNDYLSFPENASSYAGCHAESVSAAVGAESGSESLTRAAFQRGIVAADWLFPGSLASTRFTDGYTS